MDNFDNYFAAAGEAEDCNYRDSEASVNTAEEVVVTDIGVVGIGCKVEVD